MVENRTILFSGRVQGVGFRATTVHLAHGLPLSGTVENLPDGRVQLVLLGEAAQIDSLVARLREHFASFLRTVDQHVHPPLPAGAPSPPGIRIVH